MKRKLVALYKLQKVDSKLMEINERRGELPEEIQSLKDSIEEAEEELRLREEELKNVISAIESVDIDIAMQRENRRKWRRQLTSVKSNEEYDALQRQIQGAEERIDELTQRKKDLTEQQKSIEEEIKALKDEIKERRSELNEKQKELEKIDKEIASDEKKLLKVREKFAKDVEPMLLKRYERIKSVRGTAVSPVVNGVCGGCSSRVPAQRIVELRQNNRLYTCESCGRILISDEVVEEAEKEVKKAIKGI